MGNRVHVHELIRVYSSLKFRPVARNLRSFPVRRRCSLIKTFNTLELFVKNSRERTKIPREFVSRIIKSETGPSHEVFTDAAIQPRKHFQRRCVGLQYANPGFAGFARFRFDVFDHCARRQFIWTGPGMFISEDWANSVCALCSSKATSYGLVLGVLGVVLWLIFNF